MSFAYASPEKESFVLVQFRYGDIASPYYARYTDWNEEYVGGYAPTPSMVVKWPENSGTFDERTLNIELPLDSFTDPASSGVAHAPMFVTVQEITRALTGGPQATNLVPFKGRVDRVIRNYQGRANRVLFKCLPRKSRLDLPLGLPCNHHCVWTLFGPGCFLSSAGKTALALVDSIDGKVLTSSAGSITGRPDKWWHRGYAKYDGLRIGIHNWSLSDPTKLYMREQPPASWAGKLVTFFPGCDKTIETCRDRHNNEEHFAGVGYAIPAYNPLLENPS